MKDNILKIEKNIWNAFSKENNIGLHFGLSGTILFYDYLYKVYAIEEFENKLLSVIEKVNELIENQNNSITLSSGIAGYGLALLRLKTDSVEISEEYFENIDSFLFEPFELLCNSNDYDFMHEAMGVAMYYIERYKSNKNDKIANILTVFSANFIHKINTDFSTVLLKSDEKRGDYYSLGLAHGVASYLNFLIYLNRHFTDQNDDISKALQVCATFLLSYKKYDPKTKQHYANVISSLGSDKSVPSRLSWCQGDLGVSNALFNTGVFLDDTLLIKEAIDLMNHSASVNYEDSNIDDCSVCHGSMGIVIQLYLASKKYNIDYSQEIDRWFELVKNQTNNFEQSLWYENSTNKYIPETNLLNGAVGLGLTLLTIENLIDIHWLEIINLH